MALNQSRIGHRYAPYLYEVSREKVREYALATGDCDPRYLAEKGDMLAPSTFAACFTIARGTAWAGDPELGTHPALVHGRQEFEFHRPVRVGDRLRCTPWIADITARSRNEFLTLQIDCVDDRTDEPVVTSRATLVFFGEGAGVPGAGAAAARSTGAAEG